MARRNWGGDGDAECISVVLARQLPAEDAVEHQLGPCLAFALTLGALLVLSEQRGAETLAREQCHGCEAYTLERRVVLSVGRQEARAYSGVAEQGIPGGRDDFLGKKMSGDLGCLRMWSRMSWERSACLVSEALRF